MQCVACGKEQESEICSLCMKYFKEEDKEALDDKTSREVKMEKRVEDLLCSFCPPNGGENAKRKPKHGKAKRKK